MRRLTIVQYAGDYREAFERFAAGGQATYQAQRYSVDFVGSLTRKCDQVAVVCGQTCAPYDVTLANGVRAVGVGFQGPTDAARFIRAVEGTDPTHLIMTTPYLQIFDWGKARQTPILGLLADSFNGSGLRQRYRSWQVARRLRRPGVEWVADHGLNACRSLIGIGVPARKVVPWDWPASFSPHDVAPRTRKAGPLKLAYVGSVVEAKGVGDLIDAVEILHGRGIAVTVDVFGHDPDGSMIAKAAAATCADALRFHGVVPNEQIPAVMRSADAVVVPSRHAYPEGMPLTIYEALAARTPLIASDHPMFRGVLVDGQTALTFAASDPEQLAGAIDRLGSEPALYATLSEAAVGTWESLQLPVRWGELIDAWLDGDEAWICAHSMASGLYDTRLR